MSKQDDKTGLAALRRRIDAVDDQIADLLVERMAVVADIAACKQRGGAAPGSAMRPGREAEVTRRIVARTAGAMPAPAVARIWREIISAATRSQVRFTVHVAGQSGCSEAARDHFGVLTPVVWHSGVDGAIEAMAGSPADVAVLTILYDIDDIDFTPWWTDASPPLGSEIHIVAVLNEELDDWLHVAIAAFEPEPSGDDVTFIVAEGRDTSQDSDDLLAALGDAGLNGELIAVSLTGGIPATLATVDGFIATDDQRIKAAAADPRLARVTRAGAAARLTHQQGESS